VEKTDGTQHRGTNGQEKKANVNGCTRTSVTGTGWTIADLFCYVLMIEQAQVTSRSHGPNGAGISS